MCSTTCASTRAAPEQASLRRAAQIAVGAHRRAMRFARPGRMEYEVMAEVLHEFRSHNADISYHPIVGGRRQCLRHALPRQRSAAVRRRLAAARRRLRARLLRLGHHPHLPGQRPIHRRRSAPSTRWCSRRNWRPSTRCVPATTGMSRMKPRCARSRTDWCKLGLAQGTGATAHQGAGLSAVLQPPHRPLAGPGCARCGRLQGGRRMAGAGARHGAHRRAGNLHPALGSSAQGVLEHRRAHRGRSAGDRRARRRC